jgi:dihydroflavonol-4-reductase
VPDLDHRTAFVTGATGFLGRHLVEALLLDGWQVTAVCLTGDDVSVLPPGANVVAGDITDPASLRAAMPERPDAVFHLAASTTTWAEHGAEQLRVNLGGTKNMIEIARLKGARRFVYTSSISAFGYRPGHRIDESTPSNAPAEGDNYGRSKLLAEKALKEATRRGAVEAVILNPVNVLGPYDRFNWSRQLILPIARGSLRVAPPGMATWAYVKDVADAHIAAVDRGRPGHNYVLGGVEASFAQIINEIAGILGQPRIERVMPAAVLRAAVTAAAIKSRIDHRQPVLTEPQYRRAVGALLCDDTRAREELGYIHTDLRTTLAETIDWLRREGLLDVPPTVPSTTLRRDAVLGVDYVEVADEPYHVEQFRDELVRGYLATIPPGRSTLYHRHHRNTVYVVLRGGRSRSHEPGDRQRQRTSLGRSLTAPQKVAMGLRRGLLGQLQLPTGALFVQHHGDTPLTHRLRAEATNRTPMAMLGVELLSPPGARRPHVPFPELPVEYHDEQVTAHRLRLAPGLSTPALDATGRVLLVVISGTCEPGTPGIAETRRGSTEAGTWSWLEPGMIEFRNVGADDLDAVLIAPR